jgi:hypothetical protein
LDDYAGLTRAETTTRYGISHAELTRAATTHALGQHVARNRYLVRMGWTDDGKYVWVELLNRKQTRLKLVVIPIGL